MKPLRPIRLRRHPKEEPPEGVAEPVNLGRVFLDYRDQVGCFVVFLDEPERPRQWVPWFAIIGNAHRARLFNPELHHKKLEIELVVRESWARRNKLI